MSLPTADDAFVAFERVQKSYDGETLVVKDLNLAIGKGEFLTMLGPSGSGKTTCLMMLAGFETATHGEIKLDGRPINNIPPHKRGIGMVFQNYALFPHMTIAENLAFPLQVRKMSKAETAEKVQLDGDSFNARSQDLSGGMRRRLDLAAGLLHRPRLLVLDEPTEGIQPNIVHEIGDIVQRLNREFGLTVLLVEQKLPFVQRICDHFCIMDKGRAVAAGDIAGLSEDLVKRYLTV